MRRFMLTRSKKRLDYKKLRKTGERTEKQLKGEEEAHRDNIGEISKLSNLLRKIAINEDLPLEHMSQEKLDVLSIGLHS